MSTRQPYPGLRPFDRDESDIFFGREEQTDQLLKRLGTTHFLAVVGPSGCGKSSLMRAGMIAALETGFMARAGARWRIAAMRPGSHPIARLSVALLADSALGPEREGKDNAKEFLQATLRRGPLGLVDVLQETPLPDRTNILLLVDQFEEIFRFRDEGNRDEADAFVSLLLESAAQTKVPVFVVITMRSDFIGHCALFTGLPEALNESQYLTPRLTREQRRAAIVGPARVFGGDVKPELVNRILNEMGPEPDQLPVLQHLLMRMWAHASPKESPATEGIQSAALQPEDQTTVSFPGRIMTLPDYDAVGGLKEALSKHAEEAFGKLTERQQRIAEVMFRRLCERGQNQRETRRPTALSEIARLAHAEAEEVTQVAEVFRNPQYGFILPACPEKLYPNTVLDITHECLIRLWQRLSGWVAREAESAETYRFLEQTAKRWDEKQAALWGTPDLEQALAWKKREQPTSDWAMRYGDAKDFPLAMKFLEESEEAWRASLAATERGRRRQLQHAWIVAGASLMAVVGLVVYVVLHGYLYVWPHTEYYASFAKVNGAAHGIGELRPDQLRHRDVSLEIVTRGSQGPALKMRAVDSRGELTTHHGIGTYVKYGVDEPEQSAAAQWEFAYDEFGRVTRETAYGKNTNDVLWTFAYIQTRSDVKTRTGLFLGPDGFPLRRKGYSYYFIVFDYSPEGYEMRLRYRSRTGKPLRALDQAFGQEREYDSAGNMVKNFSLGPDDKRMNDAEGNCGLVMSVDRLGSVVEATAYDAAGATTSVRDGWSRRTRVFDECGRRTEDACFDQLGKPVLNKDGYHRATYRYDESGNMTEVRYWDTGDKPAFLRHDGCHGSRVRHDERGNAVEVTSLGSDGEPATNSQGYVTLVIQYDQQGNRLREETRDLKGHQVFSRDGYSCLIMKYDPKGNRSELSYFAPDGAPVARKEGFWLKKMDYDERGNLSKAAFFAADKRPFMLGEGYASFECKYDEDGNQVESRYLDSSGKLILSNEGVAGWRARYDSQGNQIEFLYFGLDEHPKLGSDGYAGERTEYDAAGNISLVTYLGIFGQTVESKDGIAGWRSEHNALGKETLREFLGRDGRLATHRLGYAGYRVTYDRAGASVTTDYFDVDRNPAEVRPDPADEHAYHGYSRTVRAYTPQERCTEECYFGKYEELKLVGDGFARVAHTYDSVGNKVESAYFGANGEKALIEADYHRVRRDYDERGNPTDVRFFGIDGQPVNSTNGYFQVVRRYDQYGRIIESSVFDTELEPAVISDGYHRRVEEYNERGHQCGERYFGRAGPVVNENGYHSVKKVLDVSGNIVERSYHGTNDQLVLNRDTGCAVEENQYDTSGRLISMRFLGRDRKPVSGREGFARRTVKYNDRGEKIEVAAQGRNDDLVMLPAGYSISKMEYDSQGRLAWTSYFGTNGQPVSLPKGGESVGGYASLRKKYDVYGNLTEESYYDTSGEAVVNSYGYHKLQQRYNARQELEEMSTWDIQGNLAFNIFKYARVMRKYDNHGRLVEIAAYDAKGRLSAAKYGYARMTLAYDARGNQISEAYFGADGQPTVLPDIGKAGWSRTYDARGNVVGEKSIGADGKEF